MTDFWTRLPRASDTNGRDIAPDDLVRLADFALQWRTLYDSQREHDDDMLASTTKAQRAKAVKLLAHAAGARGLDEVAVLRLLDDPDAPTDELLRLRGAAWREFKTTATPQPTANPDNDKSTADKAIDAIQNAGGEWINAPAIGKLIGKSDGAVRSALSRAKATRNLPIESCQTGDKLGYRWTGE